MPANPEAVKRMILILRVSFVVAGFLFAYVAFTLPVASQTPMPPAMQIGLAAVALTDVALGFLAPSLLLRMWAKSHRQPADPIQRRFTLSVVCFALFTSCNLFAFTLHNLGAGNRLVILLFAVGIVSLIAWNPAQPPSDGGPIS